MGVVRLQDGLKTTAREYLILAPIESLIRVGVTREFAVGLLLDRRAAQRLAYLASAATETSTGAIGRSASLVR